MLHDRGKERKSLNAQGSESKGSNFPPSDQVIFWRWLQIAANNEKGTVRNSVKLALRQKGYQRPRTTMANISAAIGESYTFVCETFKTTVEESYTFVSPKFQHEFESCLQQHPKSRQHLSASMIIPETNVIENSDEVSDRREDRINRAVSSTKSYVDARYVVIKLQFSSGRNWKDGKPIRVKRGKWIPVPVIERAMVDLDFEEDLKWTIFLEKQATIMQELSLSSSPSSRGEVIGDGNGGDNNNNGLSCCNCHRRAVSLCGNPQLRLTDTKKIDSTSCSQSSSAPLMLWDLTCLPVCDSKSCHLHAKQIQRKIMAATLSIVGVQEYLPRARCNYCGIHEDTTGTMHQVCGRCKVTCYCSKNCQTMDWKRSRGGRNGHKVYCKVPPKIKGIKSFLQRS